MVIAADPLLLGPVDLEVFLIVLLKVVVAFALLMVSVMLMVWFERKLISDMQNRIGPDVAGPWGILQTLADGIKLFFKEDLIPENADRPVFKLAPYRRWCRPSWFSPSSRSAATSAPVTAPWAGSATAPSYRWPIRRWASCCSSPSPRSPSTA